MTKSFVQVLCVCLLAVSTVHAGSKQPPVSIVKPTPLPVAIDDDFEFRKTTILNNDSRPLPPDAHPMVRYERSVVEYGAITPEDFRERKGQYFTFFWKSKRRADVTLRFEYRQGNLGPFVQAREVSYSNVKGNQKTRIEIVGDDFINDGRVIAWRALLIVDNRVVATTQSYLWR